jgi:ADP-heptose:LPS heptosyltransferase
MTCTLVIRLSAFGDVAMTVPVLYSVANRYPNDEFILLTKNPLQHLFINKPENLKIFAVNTKEKYRGISGIYKLINDLNKKDIKKIADLHKVLRSICIDCYFKLKGKKVSVINKGKADKKALIRKKNKKNATLKSSVERYQNVFENLGYDASLNFTSLFADKDEKDEIHIGIAPFAKHIGKIYPLDKMKQVICLLNKKPSIKIFLFGAKSERNELESLAEGRKRIELIAGQFPLHEELSLMNNLDVMLSMDSANMHFASLVNTTVVSIWGATHPYAGFYGYKQNPNNAIQLDMPCRPCSVFGDKPCRYGTYDCLNQIKPETIVDKIMQIVN